MHGLYLQKSEDLILLENQKKGLCLISAFFQGLFFEDHTREVDLLKEIANAMSFVISNNVHFTDMSQQSIGVIETWDSKLVHSIESGGPLKFGQFWNVEILENYIDKANIQCSIFYFKEIPGEEKYVLVRTRPKMICPPKSSSMSSLC